MDKALNYPREFLRLYWELEKSQEAWSRELEGEFGLTAKQYSLLRAIERQADITTTDLTGMLGKAQPAITQMLNRLEQSGFIARETSVNDRRRRKVRLTPKAVDLFSKVDPIGPTRVIMAMEKASDREAGEVVRAIETILNWMTQRKLK
ncbi:MAG: MarR family transcriptional regulator [Planctomycetes bacterium]|nr:MarR family transcriptional regulator [Planctomycetota bacterium]